MLGDSFFKESPKRCSHSLVMGKIQHKANLFYFKAIGMLKMRKVIAHMSLWLRGGRHITHPLGRGHPGNA